MRKVDLDKIQYVGGDIVDILILENNRKYKSDHIEFVPWDLTTDKITKKYDLIITRDCFVHLSFEDIKKSINNIVESKSKYLLTTSFAKTNLNINTNTGGKWRPINLRLSPFDLPEPIDFFEETNAEAGWEGNAHCRGSWRACSCARSADHQSQAASASKSTATAASSKRLEVMVLCTSWA